MDPLARQVAYRFAAKKGKLPVAKYKALLKKVKDRAREMMGSDRSKDAAHWIDEAAKTFGLKGHADVAMLAEWAGEPLRTFSPMAAPAGALERIDKAAD